MPHTPLLKRFFPKWYDRHHPTDQTGSAINGPTKTMTNALNTAYFKTFSADAVANTNAKILLAEMKAQGITSPITQGGILSVVSKESGFKLKRENLDYTSEQLQKVFALSKTVADSIAHQPEKIANTVYMPPHNTQLGNTQPGDGWKYRGIFYNQLTGHANLDKYGKKIGVDLTTDPDKYANDAKVSAKVTIAFFKDGLAALKNAPYTIYAADGKTVLQKGTNRLTDMYSNPTNGVNGFATVADAAAAIYNINAGVGQSATFLKKDVTGGLALTMDRATGFEDYAEKTV